MPKPLVVLPGDRFGMLTIEFESSPKIGASRTRRSFVCKCECGNSIVATLDHLRVGDIVSCGCKRHGKSGSRTHRIWKGMIQRCTNSSREQFKNYGGRGITVCERWRSFENFLSDMGDAPEGRSIDRIDTNGNYEPGNCRWATPKEQSNNTRRVVQLEFLGCTGSVASMAEKFGIKKSTLYMRIRRGMSAEDAITKPNRYAAHIEKTRKASK
jgi:hypothetical protein